NRVDSSFSIPFWASQSHSWPASTSASQHDHGHRDGSKILRDERNRALAPAEPRFSKTNNQARRTSSPLDTDQYCESYKRIALWHFKQLVRYRPSARSGSIDERRFGVKAITPLITVLQLLPAVKS